MKATIRCRISKVEKKDQDTELSFNSTTGSGKVLTDKVTAQACSIAGTLMLKQLIADQIKIGATLTITVSDEGLNEGTD